MRFILGATSGVVVLMLGAVAFTVMNPLPSAGPVAELPPATLPTAAATAVDAIPTEETVTRAQASLVDAVPQQPAAAPTPALTQALAIPPAATSEPSVVTAALAPPAPRAMSTNKAPVDTLLQTHIDSLHDALRESLPDSTVVTAALAAPAPRAMSTNKPPVDTLLQTHIDSLHDALRESLPDSTVFAALPIDRSLALGMDLPPLTAPRVVPVSTTAELRLDTEANKPVLRPVAWLSPVSKSSPLPPAADTNTAAPTEMVFVTGNRVNMRTGPGSRYKWLATFSRGSGLILLDKNGRWYKVQTEVAGDIVTGWMAAGFLSSDPVDHPEAVSEG